MRANRKRTTAPARPRGRRRAAAVKAAPKPRTGRQSAGSAKRRSQKRKSMKRALLFVILLLLAVVALYQLNIIPHPYYTNKDFGIEDYESSGDMDGDGRPDQADFLAGVRDYVKTKPKYTQMVRPMK